MMRLDELKKHQSQMNKEELEIHMLHILENMNEELDNINAEYKKKHGTENRRADQKVLPKYSPSV